MAEGPGYMTDCITFAAARRLREETFRIYVTDCLYTICAWSGNKLSRRYCEIVNPVPEDDRPGDVIAAERLERFGIKVVKTHGPDEPDGDD